MKRFLILCLLVVFFAIPVRAETPPVPPPSSGSQLFFDDFISSGFPQQWTSVGTSQTSTSGISQQGGYLIMNTNGNGVGLASYAWANSTPPVFQSLIPESVQFRQITVKVQPFNLTNLVANSTTVSLAIGITSGLQFAQSCTGSGNNRSSVFFSLWETNQASLRVGLGNANFPTTKSAIMLDVTTPVTTAAKTFCMNAVFTGNNLPILYNPTTPLIDLNAMHIFTIQMQTDLGNSANDYIRFQVDNNGWFTFYQTACSCILGGPSDDIATMYPFLIATSPGALHAPSVAAQVDYFLVTDYVPAALPQGQLLASNVQPPTSLPNPYPSAGNPTGSVTNLIQFEAAQLGGGNIYAGGLFLTGLISLIWTGILGGIAIKKRDLKLPGFFWAIGGLGYVFLMFYAGVVPIWLPVVQVVLSGSVLFGIIRLGETSGGIVPD